MAGVTAAKATRKYFVDSDQSGGDDWYVFTEEGAFEMHFSSIAEAEAACNRLNAVAFLEAIRDPSDRMRKVGSVAVFGSQAGSELVWRTMVDALIEEMKDNFHES